MTRHIFELLNKGCVKKFHYIDVHGKGVWFLQVWVILWVTMFPLLPFHTGTEVQKFQKISHIILKYNRKVRRNFYFKKCSRILQILIFIIMMHGLNEKNFKDIQNHRTFWLQKFWGILDFCPCSVQSHFPTFKQSHV